MQLAPGCIWHMHPKDVTGKNELPIEIARGIGFHKEKTNYEMDNKRWIITDAFN